MNDDLAKLIDYLEEDLGEQAMRAHLDGRSEMSAALYGFAAALRRGKIDVLGDDGGFNGPGAQRPRRGIRARFGL